ncbi:MAG TPA: GNAT family N-acetyltransferase [Mycobacteriales bacterium]
MGVDDRDDNGVAALLRRVAGGGPVGFDGDLTVLPQPHPRDAAVLAFTGHSVVVADVDQPWVRDRVPEGDLSAPLCPPFLSALTAHLHRRVNNVDMITVAGALSGAPPVGLVECADRDHPRVRRALRYRDGVRVWVADGGLVLLGYGLAGRCEVAVEVEPSARGRGLGRRLARAARHLCADRSGFVWAQIAPGNAASVRAFLAAGYRPVGAEALLVADRPPG